MRFIPFTEKNKKKKIGICFILGWIRIRIWIQFQTRIWIHYPGSGSADPNPDPHRNEADPKHCFELKYSFPDLNMAANVVLHLRQFLNQGIAKF